MNPPVIILIAASVGLVLNTIAVLGVAWKGGYVLGQMQSSLHTFSSEMDKALEELSQLGLMVGQNTANIERTTAHLDGLDQRVSRIEDRMYRGPQV